MSKQQLPHSSEEHDELQSLTADLGRWVETETGKSFTKSIEDTGMPGFAMHILMDCTQTNPTQLPQAMNTIFVLGAKYMRGWMEKRQAEALPPMPKKDINNG